jgi:hypothetical protein
MAIRRTLQRASISAAALLSAAALHGTTVAQTNANVDAALLQLLTCNIPRNEQVRLSLEAQLKARGARDADGGMTLDAPVRDQTVCVEKAHVAASFGVLAVTAAVCSDTAAPLLGLVRQHKPKLSQRRGVDNPAVLGVYEDGKYTFMLFKGAPSPQPTPDATSSQLTYACYFQQTTAR